MTGLDRILLPLLSISDEDERRSVIERIVSIEVQPIVNSILSRKLGTSDPRAADDADDIRNDVIVRLMTPLQNISSSQQVTIENFREYVAGVTYHAFNNYLRTRYPERSRLKNHLKYVLTHSDRFALWPAGPRTIACGFATSARSSGAADAEVAVDLKLLAREAFDANDPARAIAVVFETAVGPLELESFVNLMATLWNVRDEADAENYAAGERIHELPSRDPSIEDQLDSQRFFQQLWIEICHLKSRQRTALLLSLREGAGQSALPLFVVLGVASIRKIAAALALEPDALAAFWGELPFDDLRIAGMLGVTRQQVINLRKSARERLARRTKH